MASRFKFRLRTLLMAFVPIAIMALCFGYYLRLPRPLPASGTVTLDGVSLADAWVFFNPMDYMNVRPAAGMTDMTGVFRLQTTIGGSSRLRAATAMQGAYPSSYWGAVRPAGTTGAAMMKSVIPERYEHVKSGLTTEEADGAPNVFVSNLTTPKTACPRTSGLPKSVGGKKQAAA